MVDFQTKSRSTIRYKSQSQTQNALWSYFTIIFSGTFFNHSLLCFLGRNKVYLQLLFSFQTTPTYSHAWSRHTPALLSRWPRPHPPPCSEYHNISGQDEGHQQKYKTRSSERGAAEVSDVSDSQCSQGEKSLCLDRGFASYVNIWVLTRNFIVSVYSITKRI